jgi:hypothetical protein
MMYLKNWRIAENSKYTRKGVTVASTPKVSFLPDGGTSSGNYGYQAKYEV